MVKVVREYNYQDNMEIVDHILNELMLVRTIEEIEGFKKSLMMTYLKMFPSVTPDSDIIESIFNHYCDEHNVKEWYESTFKVPLKKIKNEY